MLGRLPVSLSICYLSLCVPYNPEPSQAPPSPPPRPPFPPPPLSLLSLTLTPLSFIPPFFIFLCPPTIGRSWSTCSPRRGRRRNGPTSPKTSDQRHPCPPTSPPPAKVRHTIPFPLCSRGQKWAGKGRQGREGLCPAFFHEKSPERRRPGVLSGAIFPRVLRTATCAVPVRRRFFRSI
jgi:hypothetical protein